MQCLAHFWDFDHFSEIQRLQIVVSIPTNIAIFFQFSDNDFGNPRKLSQGRLRAPCPSLDHFAQSKSFCGQRGPTSFQRYFKETSHEAASRLLDISHISDESETLRRNKRKSNNVTTSSLSLEMYAWRSTFIFADGSSTPSFTGIGTRLKSLTNSNFSSSRT
jgi:hypothetical protein